MFKEIKFSDLKENLGEKLKNEWALVCAGDEKAFNMMTISWGAFGELWNKNMMTIYIRENRHTTSFLEKEEYFTINFFPKEYKKELGICGMKSGKDFNKLELTGFTKDYDKAPFINEANLVLICKKIAKGSFKDYQIYDDSVNIDYNSDYYHNIYNGEIVKVLRKEQK